MSRAAALKRIYEHEGFKKYVEHVSWNLLGRVVSMVIGFLVTAYVIRYLGPERNGHLAYASTLVGLFTFFAGLGIDGVLYRDLIVHPDKRDELLGTASFLKLGGALVSLLVLGVVMLVLKTDLRTNILILIFWLPLLLQGIPIINIYFQGRLESKVMTINYLSITVLVIACKIAFVVFSLNIYWFALLSFVETAFYCVGYLYIYWKSNLDIRDWRFNPTAARAMIFASWPLVLSAAFTMIYSRIDQVMLGHYLGFGTVGVYDVGVKVAELWYFFPTVVVGSLFPAIVNIKKGGDKRAYEKRLVYLYSFIFYSSVLVIFPVTLFSGQIINLLYGSAFLGAGIVLKIYAWSGISVGLGLAVNQYLINENYTKKLFFFNFLSMVGNVVLNLILIPKYGMAGAALATLISYSLSVLGVVFFKSTRRQLRLIGEGIIFKNIFYGA